MTSPAKKGQTGPVVQDSPYQRLMRQFDMEADSDADRNVGGSWAETAAQTIMEADSLEAAFAAQDQSLPSGKDLVDEEIKVVDFTVQRSDTTEYGEGLPYYLRIQAVRLSDASELTFATGATNIVMLLWRAKNELRLPLDVRITGKEAKNGTVLGLKLIPKRAI